MTITNQTPGTARDHVTTWLDVSASYGRERAQLLAVDGQTPSRNAQIAEANNQQAHALKLAEIHALLAIAEPLERIARDLATLRSYAGVS